MWLNKILLQDKANEAKIQVKEMDIQNKKELPEVSKWTWPPSTMMGGVHLIFPFEIF